MTEPNYPFPESLQSKYDFPKFQRVVTDHLSIRQKAMLAWVADGATNEEISQHLNLSQNVIEADFAEAFNLLGVRSRIEVAVIWGFVSFPVW